mmetsp:Transcript_2690/g.7900  ORF Transcript_2690/g.7900 Transcript_2690/m.7900 type:complete len:97 (+) Transcript_2690:385-675(+)
MAGVRHELGCSSQRLRADAAALKRVYIGLRDEAGRLGAGVVKNGVRGYLENLSEKAEWGNLVLGKAAAKTKAKEYVSAAQKRAFEPELKERSTLPG